MVALNGTVVPAFDDEAITILCISPLSLERFSLHRNFLTLLMLKYPEIRIRRLRGKGSAKWMALNPLRHLLFLYATPQTLGAWRGLFPKSGCDYP
jgi:hypothetical protein